MAAVQKISVTEAEKRFNAFGLPDYRLRNVTDLKVIFGHDVKLLKGYSDLTAEQQQLFDAFICNYYNCVGMARNTISHSEIIFVETIRIWIRLWKPDSWIAAKNRIKIIGLTGPGLIGLEISLEFISITRINR